MVEQVVMPWGEPTEREADFWPTPAHCVESLLLVCPPPPCFIITEPSAGDGAIVRVLVDYGYEVAANDLRDMRKELREAGANPVAKLNWLTCDKRPGESIITNPPFSIAQEFTRACLESKPRYLALLLRLNVMGSNPWADLWLEYPPTGIYSLRKRPSFSGDGKTDACNYGWFTWVEGESPMNFRPI